VRFRHLDNDIVRADRQQGFLREASAQMSTSRLLHNLNPLVKAFAKSTSSDSNLQTSRGILRLLRLAASSSGKPVRQVTFPHTFVQSTPAAAPPTAQAPLGAPTAPIGLGDYVTATPEQIQAAVRRFMHPRRAAHPKPTKVPKKRSGKRRRARVSAASYGLVPGLGQAKTLVRPALRRRFKLPFYAPAWMTQRGRYPASTGVAPAPRLYTLPDRGGKRHQAYRLVVAENETEGQYYGIQGTTWRNPPILDGPHSTQRIGGRTYRVYNDGAHIRLVAWETPRGVYWVSNSLSRALSNREMLGIARSLTRIPRG
jgi:polyisoprenyl-teichoic acid--peptidoglycan teichoic acid transferase